LILASDPCGRAAELEVSIEILCQTISLARAVVALEKSRHKPGVAHLSGVVENLSEEDKMTVALFLKRMILQEDETIEDVVLCGTQR